MTAPSRPERNPTLIQIELMLAAAHERQALLRLMRESGRYGRPPSRLRHRIGRSLIWLGHRIAGESASGWLVGPAKLTRMG